MGSDSLVISTPVVSSDELALKSWDMASDLVAHATHYFHNLPLVRQTEPAAADKTVVKPGEETQADKIKRFANAFAGWPVYSWEDNISFFVKGKNFWRLLSYIFLYPNVLLQVFGLPLQIFKIWYFS